MDQSMYIVLCSSTVNPCSSCLMLTKSSCTSFVTYSNRLYSINLLEGMYCLTLSNSSTVRRLAPTPENVLLIRSGLDLAGLDHDLYVTGQHGAALGHD